MNKKIEFLKDDAQEYIVWKNYLKNKGKNQLRQLRDKQMADEKHPENCGYKRLNITKQISKVTRHHENLQSLVYFFVYIFFDTFLFN